MKSQPDSEFDEFFAARAPSLRRTAFVVVHDWHAAEDIVQSVFVKLYLAWPRLRRESVDAYARRAVVNAGISHVRKRGREIGVENLPEQPDDREAESFGGLMESLASLPPAQRAVIALRFLDDLPVSAVADALGVSEGTVKSHTSRGLSSLRGNVPSMFGLKE